MKTDRKMIQRVSPTDEPITKICVGDEEVFSIPKDGNWEIERVFLDYWMPHDELIVVLKRKEK